MSDLLNQASLVMVPSGYKEDTVYSVVPSDGSGDLSFTRASNGTRVNSAGLVEVCPWNLLTYSSVLSDSSYTISELNRTDSQTDPNGGNTGALFTGTSATNAYILKSFSTIIGQVYTCSVYLKGNSSGSVSIRVDGAGTAPVNNVNYTTSYQQFTYTFTADSTTSTLIIGGYNTWLGSEAIYVAFPQANIGSTAKPYFPTTDRLNVPRLTYQNGGGGCPSLLLEKQSTNLALQSQSFISPWAIGNYLGTNPVITQNYGISPDGTQNAVRIQLARTNSNDSYSQVYQYPISVSVGQQYTWSVYLKSLSGTPTISIVGDFGRPPVTLTSEWVRYTGTGTATASQTQLEIAILGSNYATGNSLSADFLAYGYQIEQSSYPTSYIPTTSSSATRVADACFKTGISSLIGQTEGTLFADVNWNVKPEAGSPIISILALNNNVANLDNCIILGIERQSGGSNRVYCFVQNSGSTVAGLFGSNITNGRYKIAFAYKNNDFVLYVNGVQIATDTSGTPPTTSEVLLGQRFQGDSFSMNDSINETVLFKTRLTNAELASLTTI
jgi:hypothetical protein